LIIKKHNFESRIQVVNTSEIDELKNLLVEVGAKVGDVFGVEKIIWVEGPTEEIAFEKIIRKVLRHPLNGCAIVGVKSTGDFESKKSDHARLSYDVYTRLSTIGGIMPRTCGFIFDKEGKNDRDIQNLRKINASTLFLSKRMIENYVFSIEAILYVMNLIDPKGFPGAKQESLSAWLDTNKWNKKYFDQNLPKEKSDEYWQDNVHASKLLIDIFEHFSDSKYPYNNKPKYTNYLIDWFIENNPGALDEISKNLIQLLET
jgi:hypothetical protein